MIKKTLIAAALLSLVVGFFAARDLRTDVKFRGPMPEYVEGISIRSGTDGMIAMLADVNDYRDGSVIRDWYEQLTRFMSLSKGIETEADARRHLTFARHDLRDGDTEDALEVFHAIESAGESAQLSAEFQAEIEGWIALSYLRMGEQQNCFNNPHASACIVPLDPRAVHQLREGSTKAIEYYEGKILPREPDNFAAKWLLNIAYMTLGQYPGDVPEEHLIPMPGAIENYDGPAFANVADFAGVDDINRSGATVIDDFDNDGLLDIFTTGWQRNGFIHLYLRNQDGTFRDSTEAAGLAGLGGGLNATQADYNNDGFPDVYLMRGAWGRARSLVPNSLLRNNGDGTFTDVTVDAGVLEFEPTGASSFADIDNDGWLDLIVANETQGKVREHGVISIFMNDQNGGFTPLPEERGITVSCSPKGVAIGDYDGDSHADIFISCLRGENMLMHNLAGQNGGAVSFEDVTEQAGVAAPVSSFATWFFDYDNDGLQDLFVASHDYGSSIVSADVMGRSFAQAAESNLHPALYRNLGNGRFEDVTQRAGLTNPSFTMGANFGDFDNDGWLDMYWGTGEPPYQSIYPNTAMLNLGGRGFQNITASSGLGHIQKGHGLAFADFDQDGDQDIFAQMGGGQQGDVFQNALFENRGNGNKWLKLKLQGKRSNHSAIGARIRVDVTMADGSMRTLHRAVNTGGSFGSNPLLRHIGLGNAASIERVTVEWPASGITQPLTGFELNSAYRITEGTTGFDAMPHSLRRFTTTKKPKAHDHNNM